jgi:hypothetical protein
MVSLNPQDLDDGFVRMKWNTVPLRKDRRAEEYPVDRLPPLIADAVTEVQAYVQAPMALVAACALSVVSSAVQARFDVQRDAVLKGPSSLYFMTIAESGERKTAIDKMFMAPLYEWQAKQSRAYREQRAQYEVALEAWKERGKDLEDRIAGGLHAETLGTAIDPRRVHEAMMPKAPRKAEMLRGDDTTEAMLIAMQDYPVAALLSAEAGMVFGGHSMGGDKAMGNLGTFNTMWDGGTLRQSRVGRDPIYVERPRATLGLMVQPAVLQSFTLRTGNLAKGIGYFARFLFSQPESTQGGRYYLAPAADMPALRTFHARVAALLDVPVEFDDLDRLAPREVPLDPEAQACWIAFHDEVEEQLGDDYSDVKDVASKAAENAARLACCYHAFETDGSSPIPRMAMDRACAAMRWYLDEAVRFGQVSGLTEEVRDAELVEAFLVAQHKEVVRGKLDANKVTVQRVRNFGPGSLRGSINAKRIDAAIEVLVDHGRIRVFAPHGSKSRCIVVAPSVMMEYS